MYTHLNKINIFCHAIFLNIYMVMDSVNVIVRLKSIIRVSEICVIIKIDNLWRVGEYQWNASNRSIHTRSMYLFSYVSDVGNGIVRYLNLKMLCVVIMVHLYSVFSGWFDYKSTLSLNKSSIICNHINE